MENITEYFIHCDKTYTSSLNEKVKAEESLLQGDSNG